MRDTLKPPVFIRILWVETFAAIYGRINRADSMRAWELSPTVASRDFQELLGYGPDAWFTTLSKTARLDRQGQGPRPQPGEGNSRISSAMIEENKNAKMLKC